MMKSTLAQSEGSNDLVLDSKTNDLAMVYGNEAYAVIIADAVRTVTGELQYNTEKGIPYFDSIFRSVNLTNVWKSKVRETVTAMPFVISIYGMMVSYNAQSRVLSYSLEVLTDDGIITIRQ